MSNIAATVVTIVVRPDGSRIVTEVDATAGCCGASGATRSAAR